MSVSVAPITPVAPLPITRSIPFVSNTATSAAAASRILSSVVENSSPYYPSTADSSIMVSSSAGVAVVATAHLPSRAGRHSLLSYPPPYPVKPSAAEASIAVSTTRWRPNKCDNSFPYYSYPAESSTVESSAMVSSSSSAIDLPSRVGERSFLYCPPYLAQTSAAESSAATYASTATHPWLYMGKNSSPSCYPYPAESSAMVFSSSSSSSSTTAAHLRSRVSAHSFLYHPPYPAKTSAAESSAAAYVSTTTHPWPYASENSSPSCYPYPSESSTAESSATVSSSSPAVAAHLPSRAGECSFLYYPPYPIQEPSATASVTVTTTHIPSSARKNSLPCHPYPDFSYHYAQDWSMGDGNGYGYGQTWTEVLPETGDYKGYGCDPAWGVGRVLARVGLTGGNINCEPLPPLFENYPSCSGYGYGNGWGGAEEAVAEIGGDYPLVGVFYGDSDGYGWSTMEEAGPAPSWPPAPLCRLYNQNLIDRSKLFTPATGVLPKHSLLKAEPSEPAAMGKEKGSSKLFPCLGLTPFSLEAEPKSDPCSSSSSSSRGEKTCSGLSSEAVKKPHHGRDKACSDLSSGADKKRNHSGEKTSNSSVAEEEKASCGKEEEKEDRRSLHMGIVSEIEQIKLREEVLNHTLLPGCSPILVDGTVHDEVGPKTLKEPTKTVVGCNTKKSKDIPENVIVSEKICLAKEEHGSPSAFHLPASRHEMLAMSICNLCQVLAEKQAAGLSGDAEVKFIESTICNLSYCLLKLTEKGKSARTKQSVKNQLITDSMDTEADSDLIEMRKVLDVNKDSIGNCPSVPSCKKDHVIKSSKEHELKKVPMQDESRLLEEITKLKTSFLELKDQILNEASENSAISDMYKKLCMDTEGSLALLRLEMIEAKQSIEDLKQTFMQDEGRLREEITKLKTSFSELKDRILNEASENSAISDMYKKLCMDTEGSLALLRLEMIEAKQSIEDLKQTFMKDEGRLPEEITKLKTSFSELKDRILNEASENSAILDMYKNLCMDTESSFALLRLEMIEAKQSIKDLRQTFMLMHKPAIGYQGSVEASEDSLHCSTCKREGCENKECKEATEIEGGEGVSDGENLRGVVVLEQGGEGRTRGRRDDGSVLEKEKSFPDTDKVWSRFVLPRTRSIAPSKDDSTMGDLILVSGNELEEDWVHL